MSATGRRFTVSVSRCPASSFATTAAVELRSSLIETSSGMGPTVALGATVCHGQLERSAGAGGIQRPSQQFDRAQAVGDRVGVVDGHQLVGAAVGGEVLEVGGDPVGDA